VTSRDLLARAPLGGAARADLAAQRRTTQDLGLGLALQLLLLLAVLVAVIVGTVQP
jgi:hypothetical protein